MLINTICDHLSARVIAGELSNHDLVQIIEHCGAFLNLKTRSAYAKENNMSYNGVKKHRTNVRLFGATFIIDNV